MALQKRTEYYPRSRNDWRKWLQKNGALKDHVWLIVYKKKSGKPSVTYDEIVEEALCYGWIDSKPNKRDEESYYLFLAPRKPKSPWSALNKKRIEKLQKQNLLAESGRVKIEAAKKDGSWKILDNIEKMLMPVELKKLLAKNKKARQNFDQFPPSAKKAIYQWIETAKTTATKQTRITQTIILAEQNIRANQWQPNKKM